MNLSIITNLMLLLASSNNKLYSVMAQQSSSAIDPDLINRPGDSIDFEGCFRDLVSSDRDGDGYVKQNEYLSFVQTYGKRICFTTDALTLQQSSVFNSLACICRDQEGQNSNCCLGDNAKIPTDGGLVPPDQRNPTEQNYLTSVCKLTDATINSQCPPTIEDREEPAFVVKDPITDSSDTSQENNGMEEWWIWLLIGAAIIMLLCCLFGFVYRKRRSTGGVVEQSNEVQEANIKSTKEADVYYDPEQPLGHTSTSDGQGHQIINNDDDVSSDFETIRSKSGGSEFGSISGAGAFGSVIDIDSEDEEDVRRKIGGSRIIDSDDDDIVLYQGAPRLPPPQPEPKTPNPLRPIPANEHEDEEWDQPGRNIDYPIEKNDMSACEVDHYVPDGGVHMPQRPQTDKSNWKKEWTRSKPEESDDTDNRKHRIQSGLGEGAVWDQLDADSEHAKTSGASGNNFDWVMQSALGALDNK